MPKQMTVVQAAFLASKAEALFDKAAQAWVRGNNSGDSRCLARSEVRCDRLRNEAVALLKPLGIGVDFPGLYPSFTVNGFSEHSCLAAVSAALAGKAVAA